MKRYGSGNRPRGLADGRKALAPAMALWCAAVAAVELRGQVTGVGPETYIGAVIVSPGNDAAVRGNAGNLTVRARIDPQLQNGHRLQLLLDGVPRGVARRMPAFELQNIDRGTHSLQLQILDNAGGVVFTGAPSTFHLLRHSRLHP